MKFLDKDAVSILFSPPNRHKILDIQEVFLPRGRTH